MEIICGIDWAEREHEVALVDQDGRLLARQRISDDVAGFTALTGMLAVHTGTAFTAVDVAIETDRGLLVAALHAAGSFGCPIPQAEELRDRRALHRPGQRTAGPDGVAVSDYPGSADMAYVEVAGDSELRRP